MAIYVSSDVYSQVCILVVVLLKCSKFGPKTMNSVQQEKHVFHHTEDKSSIVYLWLCDEAYCDTHWKLNYLNILELFQLSLILNLIRIIPMKFTFLLWILFPMRYESYLYDFKADS